MSRVHGTKAEYYSRELVAWLVGWEGFQLLSCRGILQRSAQGVSYCDFLPRASLLSTGFWAVSCTLDVDLLRIVEYRTV